MKRALLLVLLLAAPVMAAPPKLTIPAEVKPTGQYAVVTPESDAASIVYVGLDGLEPFPAALLADKRVFVLDTFGKKAGRYRFAAVAASKDGEQARADFTLIIEGATPPPPDKPPPDSPGQPTGSLHFLIVRPDGPAQPEFTRIMSDPAWAELLKAGHQFKDKTESEASALGVRLDPSAPRPCVVTLRPREGGQWSDVVRGPIPLPNTGQGILDLPKGVK